ncbi:periplasmic nitrate reductase, NapE protein [Comamonas piscis]
MVNKNRSAAIAHSQDTPLPPAAEWRRVLLLAFVGLPIMTLLAVCAYGFAIWFMQILFWGPPQ